MVADSPSIQSAVLPQYTLRTDRPTDRWSRRMFRTMSAPLAMLIESDALIIATRLVQHVCLQLGYTTAFHGDTDLL